MIAETNTAPNPQGVQTLSPLELQRRLEAGDRFQLLDVRSASEHASGHIPGALNIPLEQVEFRLEDLHAADPVVLICQSGNRASMCGELLRDSKDGLLLLEGGVDAWANAGLPVLRSTASRWSIDRQVRLAAGLLVLLGTLGSLLLHPGWLYVAMFVGAGLTFAGLTNVCGMASLFAILPWNKPSSKACNPTTGVAR